MRCATGLPVPILDYNSQNQGPVEMWRMRDGWWVYQHLSRGWRVHRGCETGGGLPPPAVGHNYCKRGLEGAQRL